MSKGDMPDLNALLGGINCQECKPISVDGICVDHKIVPQTGEELSEALSCLSQHDLKALVCGSKSHLDFGNLPSHVDVLLCMESLSGIREIDVEEGVVHLSAGTLLSEARQAAFSAGWELPLDPPGSMRTVGGALATASTGPRFSHPRDVVLGLEVTLATGARTKCGGRVIKNVTGYDLAKLYIGSLGSLGVIESAWIRMKPIPEKKLVLFANLFPGSKGYSDALLASRHITARAGAILTSRMIGRESQLVGSPGSVCLVLELAGDTSAVERDRESISKVCAIEGAEPELIDRVREWQGGENIPGAARIRIRCLSSKVEAVVSLIDKHGGGCLAYPARGQVVARFDDDSETGDKDIFRIARHASEIGCGSFVVERISAKSKVGCDVFGFNSDNMSLHASLKSAFDPQGVLNPGRFAGFV